MFLGQFVIEKYPKGTILFHDSSPTWLAKLGLPWPLSANDAAPASLGEIFRYQPAHVLVQHIFKRKHKMQILIVEKHMIISHYHIIAPFSWDKKQKHNWRKKPQRPLKGHEFINEPSKICRAHFFLLYTTKKKRFPFKWSNHCQATDSQGSFSQTLWGWLILLIKARFQLSHLRGLYATIFSLLTCLCQLAKDECVTG